MSIASTETLDSLKILTSGDIVDNVASKSGKNHIFFFKIKVKQNSATILCIAKQFANAGLNAGLINNK